MADPLRTRDLHPLLRPGRVAIVGASSRPESLGGRPLTRLQEAGFAGQLWPVNPRADRIGGLRAFASVADLPDTPDVAIVVVPAAQVVESLEACAARQVPAAIVISSGFAELGDAGDEAQRAIRAVARDAGMHVLGPNCVGLVNYRDGIPLTFGQSGDLRAGRHGTAAVVSQSGALTTCVANRLFDAGVGANVAVSTGNEADLTAIDVLAHLAEDDTTDVLVAVMEEVRDGAGLVALAERAHELGKPLVLCKVGRTDAGAAAVRSHTGALAGSHRSLQGVLRRHGVLEATSLDELVDLAMVAAPRRPLRGPGVAVLSVSGGAGAMAADAVATTGLHLPSFPVALQTSLAERLPGFAGAVSNPIDTTPAAMSNPEVSAGIFDAILGDDAVDALVAITPGASGDRAEAARRQLALIEATGKPVVEVVLAGSDAEPFRRPLLDRGVPVFSSPDAALSALGHLRRWYAAEDRPAAELGGDAPSIELGPGPYTEDVSKAVLAELGVPVVEERLVTDRDAAVAAAGDLGFPVVLKVRSADVAHKTEVGGVRLRLSTPAEVAEAYDGIVADVTRAAPNARIDGVLVAPMVASTLELIAGFDRDPTFGPMVLLGLGGIWAEVLDDVTLRPAPLAPGEVTSMIDDLRGAELLRGARGLPPVPVEDLEALLHGLASLALASEGQLDGADLNPVAVTPEGRLCVLDAQLYASTPATAAPRDVAAVR
ncbi:acetate--CoA ligase family protein [Nitriliruptoraceae bacterium ZYF776]|nr:acetate--CoA ligase family protein [Profundirhabdus halotolerans]